MTGLIDPPTMEQLARVVHGTVNKELDRVVRVAVELSGADTRSMNISWSLVIASLILGCRRNGTGLSPTSFFPPASTGVTISTSRTDTTFTTEWPTPGSAWHALTCRKSCPTTGRYKPHSEET